jgi:micrococcal nuclease
MRLVRLIPLALLVAAIGSAAAPASQSGRFLIKGKVTGVVDGDTIYVRLGPGKGERVRLIGVTAPDPGTCGAAEATAFLRKQVGGRRVVLVGDRTQPNRDAQRHRLAYVETGFGQLSDIGRHALFFGYVQLSGVERPFARLAAYQSAELSAKSAERRIWRTCLAPPPTPPPAPPPAPPPPPPPPTLPVCHASYPTVCIPPPPPKLECSQIPHRRFAVRHDVPNPDPHGFDPDGNGVGCET